LKIGSKVAVSQRAFLCTATHEIATLRRALVIHPVVLSDHVWICAEAFIGPGVTIGKGTVVGARAAAFSDLPAWKVAGGIPARVLKDRVLIDS
jgi:putative colanic acid biosynthesis acetyltransferase WcaF